MRETVSTLIRHHEEDRQQLVVLNQSLHNLGQNNQEIVNIMNVNNEALRTRLEQIEEVTNANYQALNEGFKDMSRHALLALEIAERTTGETHTMDAKLNQIIAQLTPMVHLLEELRNQNDEHNRNLNLQVNEAMDDIITPNRTPIFSPNRTPIVSPAQSPGSLSSGGKTATRSNTVKYYSEAELMAMTKERLTHERDRAVDRRRKAKAANNNVKFQTEDQYYTIVDAVIKRR
jgi:hypothetical protein